MPVQLLRQPWPKERESEHLLRLLLAQDGSTTRLCRLLLGSSELALHSQEFIATFPAEVGFLLGDPPYMERISSLHAQGKVALDHLVLIAHDRLPKHVRAAFHEGRLPIGSMIETLPVRRTFVNDAAMSAQFALRLSEFCGALEQRTSRLYTISFAAEVDLEVDSERPSKRNLAAMVIFETYRGSLAEAFTVGF